MLSSCQKMHRPKKKRNCYKTVRVPLHRLAPAVLPRSDVWIVTRTTKESLMNSSCGRCEQGVKKMWYVWVTLITHRFRRTPVSLVGLISGHCLKVEGVHSHYLQQENPIIHTMKWAPFSQCTQELSISLGWTHVFAVRANLWSELAVRNLSWSARCCLGTQGRFTTHQAAMVLNRHQNQCLENRLY